MLAKSSFDHQLAKMHAGIECYYTAMVSHYGPTPRGADWTCIACQELRFAQLLKLCDFAVSFSLNDVGCGYGALVAYLAGHHPDTTIDHLGIDLSSTMISHAGVLWQKNRHVNFIVANASPRIADYSVASGIFNVKLYQPIDRWERLIAGTLTDMHATSRKGFSVNFLSREANPQPELYLTRPDLWIRYCEHELGSSVELVSGYGLPEFTLIIRI